MRNHRIAGGAFTDRSRPEIRADREGANDEIAIGDDAAQLTVFDDGKNADIGLASASDADGSIATTSGTITSRIFMALSFQGTS